MPDFFQDGLQYDDILTELRMFEEVHLCEANLSILYD